MTRETLTNLIAEAISVWHDKSFQEQARQVILALEAAGVRMVPVEATEEMCETAYKALVPVFDVERCEPNLKDWAYAFQAMLSASPFAPPAKDTRND